MVHPEFEDTQVAYSHHDDSSFENVWRKVLIAENLVYVNRG